MQQFYAGRRFVPELLLKSVAAQKGSRKGKETEGEADMNCAGFESKVNTSLTAPALSSDTTDLELRRPPEPECSSSQDWLAEVREMRGRVLYDHGRRPFFRRPDGSFDDIDPMDLNAYHIVARSLGQVVGCARIVPLSNVDACAISSTIGDQRFQEILQDLGTVRERTCEASRWVVMPECRGTLGPHIVAASWAVASWLAVEVAFVLVGARSKQDLALIRMGARAVSGLPVFPSERFDDELRLLYFDVFHPCPSMQRRMMEAATDLKLTLLDSPNCSPGLP